jgi:hypothetical protein
VLSAARVAASLERAEKTAASATPPVEPVAERRRLSG